MANARAHIPLTAIHPDLTAMTTVHQLAVLLNLIAVGPNAKPVPKINAHLFCQPSGAASSTEQLLENPHRVTLRPLTLTKAKSSILDNSTTHRSPSVQASHTQCFLSNRSSMLSTASPSSDQKTNCPGWFTILGHEHWQSILSNPTYITHLGSPCSKPVESWMYDHHLR